MSAKFVSNKDETIRLFENPILEYFTHINPITPFLVFIPAIVFLAYQASHALMMLSLCVTMLFGLASWTLFEYILHRFVFHYEPKTEWGKKLHFMSHGIHHDYPRDSTRLVMPLGISLPLAIVLYIPCYVLADTWGQAGFAGFLIGYLLYDGIHYAVHHFPLQSKVGKYLKSYHLKHHFLDEGKSFGVSSPLWDYVFSTNPDKHSKFDND